MDQDPFGFSTKTIAGDYQLEKSESNDFYIERKGVDTGGGGVIEGTVQAIGWKNGIILAKRFSTFRGDPDGWMIIDTKTHKISGPISDEVRMADPLYKDFEIFSPEEAFRKL